MSACSRVLFTDETHFAVKPIKNNSKLWRREGERLNTQCIQPTFKSGYEMINCWGVSQLRGRIDLLRIEGKHDQFMYKNVIVEVLIPVPGQMFGDYRNMILQEDNWGPYVAISIREISKNYE